MNKNEKDLRAKNFWSLFDESKTKKGSKAICVITNTNYKAHIVADFLRTITGTTVGVVHTHLTYKIEFCNCADDIADIESTWQLMTDIVAMVSEPKITVICDDRIYDHADDAADILSQLPFACVITYLLSRRFVASLKDVKVQRTNVLIADSLEEIFVNLPIKAQRLEELISTADMAKYLDSLPIVRNVSYVAYDWCCEGRYVYFVGVSGSGKTTMLNSLYHKALKDERECLPTSYLDTDKYGMHVTHSSHIWIVPPRSVIQFVNKTAGRGGVIAGSCRNYEEILSELADKWFADGFNDIHQRCYRLLLMPPYDKYLDAKEKRLRMQPERKAFENVYTYDFYVKRNFYLSFVTCGVVDPYDVSDVEVQACNVPFEVIKGDYQ